MKQSVCMIAALALFFAAAGVIETHPGFSIALLALMTVPMYIGGLGKKRVTCADIERRCANAKS